jgi:peptidoglycan/xylan/chitin deacetylase (PgdA/CDA1 family)
MGFIQIWSRLQARNKRTASVLFFRKPLKMDNQVPFISFTFDDFPRSAFHAGGDILLRSGLRATYYASLGLMGTEAPTGPIFTLDDVKELLARGDELGCHTFDHCHSLISSPRLFEDSIIKNKRAINGLVPGTVFKTFSYPLDSPRLFTKRRTGRHFRCCRGGGQTFNAGTTDRNFLKSFFLEHSRDNPGSIKNVIENNSLVKGWLIFTTHDISETPTRYGCTPSFFEDIVKRSMDSGARILPVAEALDAICSDPTTEG